MGPWAEQLGRITYGEFFDLDAPDDRRYELFSGRIVVDDIPFPRHGLLSASLGSCLANALGNRWILLARVGVYCEGRFADDASAFCPDVVVACKPLQVEASKRSALTNPRAIFEILSPTTEVIDKGRKLSRYSVLESLKEYVLVSQDEKLIQVYRRGQDGWLWQAVRSGTFEICGATLSIDPIYEGVEDFPLVE